MATDGQAKNNDTESGSGWRRVVRRTLIVAAVVVAAMLVWSVAVEPRFILAEQEERAEIPQLPSRWDGARVGVIADLQVGMWLGNVDMAREAVAELVERRPDVVLVLGDFVYGDGDTADDVDTAIDIVRPLTDAGIDTFAVLGNHDHATGAADLLERRLEAIGVPVLINEAINVGAAGEELWVAGIGSYRVGNSRPRKAIDSIPADAARIVMMHNPKSFEDLPAASAPLAVAGHTHGGQLRVPFLPEWSLLRFTQRDAAHADGWIDGYGAPGNELFVNRGIGMSVVPARFNCSPAITIFELRPSG